MNEQSERNGGISGTTLAMLARWVWQVTMLQRQAQGLPTVDYTEWTFTQYMACAYGNSIAAGIIQDAVTCCKFLASEEGAAHMIDMMPPLMSCLANSINCVDANFVVGRSLRGGLLIFDAFPISKAVIDDEWKT